MSEEIKPVSSGPFDVTTVKNLAELMNQFEINEIDLRDGQQRIHLRKGGLVVASPVMQAASPMMAATSTCSETTPSKKYLEIKSPMVGTFYSKPAPEKDDYIKVGMRVSEDTVVCKIEAMKIFNDLPASCSGTVAEILVQNADFVEFDQVLFRVEPN